MDDLLREFLTETNESLDVVDVELVRFEQDPNNAAILGNIFRLVHTIKGTCGFLGLPRLEALDAEGFFAEVFFLAFFRASCFDSCVASFLASCLAFFSASRGGFTGGSDLPSAETFFAVAPRFRSAAGSWSWFALMP